MVMEMEVNWKIRRFTSSDRPHFLDWRKLVAHRDKSPDFVEWEYYSSPYGPVETWIADDNGEIVGQYSLQRYDCYFFGTVTRASLCFDVATHPDYRLQGMFTQLGVHSLREEGESNVAFTVGFPWVGGIAIPGHMNVGWTKLGELSIYARTNLADHKSQKIDEVMIGRITHFDERFDRLADAHKRDLPIMLKRSAAYLNWRYLQKVGYTYHCYEIHGNGMLIGYFVLKIYATGHDRILHIIDYILPPNSVVYQKVLDFVINFANEYTIQKVNLVINENHLFFEFLKSNDFTREERHFVPIVHRNISVVHQERLMDFRNHYFTMGDTDIF